MAMMGIMIRIRTMSVIVIVIVTTIRMMRIMIRIRTMSVIMRRMMRIMIRIPLVTVIMIPMLAMAERVVQQPRAQAIHDEREEGDDEHDPRARRSPLAQRLDALGHDR